MNVYTSGSTPHDITVRDCDMSFIGGSNNFNTPTSIRMGNGVDIYGSFYNGLFEGCKIWELYDTGMTNQGGSEAAYTQSSITYRNNVIWDCEYSYEFFLDNAGSTVNGVYFENNTCVDAGYGWAHRQRPDPYGYGVKFSNGAALTNFYIRNNIFCEAVQVCGLAVGDAPNTRNWANVTLDCNLYYGTSGEMMTFARGYGFGDLAAWQVYSGKDLHSIVALPQFVNEGSDDFHLLQNSSAIDAGGTPNIAVATDYDGTPRPQGSGYDIGAYEYTPLPTVTGVLMASSGWSSGFLNSLGGVGYAIPDGPNQLRSLPGGNLNEVIIEFSEDVNVTENDLVLTGVNVPSYGFSAFSYDAVAHRATWTLSQNLVRDKLLVDLDGSTADAVVDVAGNRLDGNWVNPTWSPPSAPAGGDAWPSGDGTAGCDFQFRINVLPGDVNQDGTVNVMDLAILAANYRKSLTGWANGDFNCDGLVDVSDLAVLAANYRLGLPLAEPVAPTRDVAAVLESGAPTLPVNRPAGETSAVLVPAATDVVTGRLDESQIGGVTSTTNILALVVQSASDTALGGITDHAAPGVLPTPQIVSDRASRVVTAAKPIIHEPIARQARSAVNEEACARRERPHVASR